MSILELIELIKKSKKHSHIYHFTDKKNFASIKVYGGLLSKEEQQNRGLICEAPGGNENSRQLDAMVGIYDDVSLCLTQNHPMAFCCRRDERHTEQYYLPIDPIILLSPGVRVSFGVANSPNIEKCLLSDGVDRIDVEVLYSNKRIEENWFQRMSSAEKLEILVPKCVPLGLIKKPIGPVK